MEAAADLKNGAASGPPSLKTLHRHIKCKISLTINTPDDVAIIVVGRLGQLEGGTYSPRVAAVGLDKHLPTRPASAWPWPAGALKQWQRFPKRMLGDRVCQKGLIDVLLGIPLCVPQDFFLALEGPCQSRSQHWQSFWGCATSGGAQHLILDLPFAKTFVIFLSLFTSIK